MRAKEQGYARFARQFDLLDKAFSGAATGGGVWGHRVYLAGARGPAFMLQGLCRVTLGMGDAPPWFESLNADVKSLEDALGAVDCYCVFGERAKSWGLDPTVHSWAAERHAHACGLLEGLMAARRWSVKPAEGEGTPSHRIHRWTERLSRARWPGPRKERRALAAFLARRALKLHASFDAFALGDLEQGLHELRRRLRWFSIYASALDGALVLDTDAAPPERWDRYLGADVVSSRFNQLPPTPEGVLPVVIPAPLFYALGWLVAELGTIKDRAQWTELAREAARDRGLPRRKSALPPEVALSHAEAGALARALVQQCLGEDRLLARLGEVLEQQR